MAQESTAETLEPSSSSIDLSNDRIADTSPLDSVLLDPSLSRNASSSRLNALAPEFVPRTSNRTDLQNLRLVIQQDHGPIHVYPTPNSPFQVPYQNYGGFAEHEVVRVQVADDQDHVPPTRNGLSDEVCQKIVNQVEYYFSDVNLATTDHLIRFINKDPEGFVPISVVASFKKIKALISSNLQLATVLRNSSKLVVSDDGKKVRRHQSLTESDMEDLQILSLGIHNCTLAYTTADGRSVVYPEGQNLRFFAHAASSRIVIAENLPDDHSYQNLMKVFSAVGSVKTIRTCQPQSSNGGASAASRISKTENMLFINKLHAFVEYETVELAEKAVSELNNERNWRSGLRVRLLLKRTSKSAQARGRKAGHEGEGGNYEEDDLSTLEQPTDKHSDDRSQSSDSTSLEHTGEEGGVHDKDKDKEGGLRRGRGRGRGKGRIRGQYHNNNRGSHVGTPPANNSIQNEQATATKQPPGPRMPDGTRGFTLGRGKPVSSGSA